MGIAKVVARKFFFPFVVETGLVRLLSGSVSANRLIVMYHGVVRKTDFNLSVNHLSVDDFEKQIKYLATRFEIISLSEMFKSYREGVANKKQIAITFDDGYENNYTNAFPVLKKYNAPATIFVVTKMLEQPDYLLWYDLIDLVKQKLDISFFKNNAQLLDEKKRYMIMQAEGWSDFKSKMKLLDIQEKELVIQRDSNEVKHALEGVDKEYRKLLTTEQMSEMITSGLIEIGSHTHHHPNLDEISSEAAKNEIEQSKKILEQKLKVEIKSIAFPDGAYNEQTLQLCKQAGYENLLAVDYKTASDSNDRNILPRFCISNTTTPESNIFQIYRAFKIKGF